MQTTHKLVVVFLLIVGALALPAAMPFANAQLSVTGVVDITSSPVTCGVNEVPPGSGMNYGSLGSNQVSTEQQFTLANAGTTAADVVVRGTDWTAFDGRPFMGSSQTHYSLTQGLAYDAMLGVPEGGGTQTLGQIDPGTQLVSYWMLGTSTLPPEDFDGDGIIGGRLTQTVTFISSC